MMGPKRIEPRQAFGRRTAVVFLGIAAAVTLAFSSEPSNQLNAQAPAAFQARLVIVPIHDGIDDVAADSLERRTLAAINNGATVVVLELNTPGGYLGSARRMVTFIQETAEKHNVKIVAWVRHEALSAGTMLSVACNEIIMSRHAQMGDCGVLLMGPGGVSTTQEDAALDAKIESPLLAYFRSAASRRGYDPLLCESFVRHEKEVWWLENTVTAERRFVGPDEKTQLLGGAPSDDDDADTSKNNGDWRLVSEYVDPLDGNTKRFMQPVVSDSELLTIDQSIAQVLGLSTAIVADEAELREYYGIASTEALARSDRLWSEELVSWLTSPTVRMFLIAMVGIGAYTEFKAPGIGLPGLVALSALIVLLGVPYLAGLANTWEIVAVIAGLLLIAVEIFVIPGFGVAGLLGILLVVLGLLTTFVPEIPWKHTPFEMFSIQQQVDGLKTGIKTLAMALGTTLLGMVLVSRYLPYVPYFKGLVPPNPNAEAMALEAELSILARVGDLGVCETVLRPAGKVRFGSNLVDVVTEGDLLDTGQTVEVVDRRGNRIVVRKVDNA